MEIELCKTGMRFYERIFDATLTEDIAAETIVPDVLPDIYEIIYADGMVFLRSKESAKGMITLGGTLRAYALYRVEDHREVQNLEFDVPFQIKVERDCIPAQSSACAMLRLQGLEVSVSNSRKASLRARVYADIECFSLKECALASSVETSDGPDLHLRNETAQVHLIGSVLEKGFVLTDEFALTSGKAIASELVGHNVELFTEDVKKVGTKLVFKGLVRSSFLWRSEDGSLEKTEWSSGFSQILETDSAEESFDTQIRLILQAAHFDMYETSVDGRNVSMQLDILAQAVSTHQQQIEYVTDAYSNNYPLALHYEQEQNFQIQENIELRDNMRGTVELPDPVLDVVQIATKIGFVSDTDNGFSCPIQIGLLFRCEDGLLKYIERNFKAEWEVPEKNNCSVLYVTCREIYAAPVSGGIEVRLLTLAQAVCRQAVPVKLLSSIDADLENQINFADLPSVTVLPYRTDDLWELAKKYHSTVELIQESNAELDSSVLLIPKSR